MIQQVTTKQVIKELSGLRTQRIGSHRHNAQREEELWQFLYDEHHADVDFNRWNAVRRRLELELVPPTRPPARPQTSPPPKKIMRPAVTSLPTAITAVLLESPTKAPAADSHKALLARVLEPEPINHALRRLQKEGRIRFTSWAQKRNCRVQLQRARETSERNPDTTYTFFRTGGQAWMLEHQPRLSEDDRVVAEITAGVISFVSKPT